MRQIRKTCVLGLALYSLVGCNPPANQGSSHEDLKTCTPEDRSLSQEELSMFEGCERLDGSVVLRYGFPDRTNFRSLIVITGNFGGGGYVGEPLTLEGFDSLEVVEGQFTFFEDNLGEYSGVPRLRSVGGFRAGALPTLVDFQGLEGLQEVRGNFDISRNPKLQSFDGLEGLRHIHGDLSIGDNPVLPPEEVDTFLERVTVDGEISLF